MQKATRYLLLCLLLCSALIGRAQSTNSGDIRGTVTDASGAVIPDVQVTVLNVDTGVSKEYTTNRDGLFDTSSIVAGNYKVTFSKEGFGELVRGPITLEVGFTTVNGQLTVGSTKEQILVTSDVPQLSTESGQQATTLDSKSLSQLPQTGQDWQNFTILLPGTSGTVKGSQGAANPGQAISANGNLPYSSVLADGATSTLSHSSNADVSVLETVSELQVTTSAFSAQYGVGGLIFNQISKGGTNQFHGSAYDYFQNDYLNSAPYGFGNKVSVSRLRYNNFGGSIGGPILKNKMFFYFNYDQIINHGAGNNGTSTVPDVATMSGDFTGQPILYDPTTQTIGHDSKGNPYPIRHTFLEEYGKNVIPGSMIDSVAAAFQTLFPTPDNHASNGRFVTPNYSNGIATSNYYSSVPNSNPFRKFFGRFDWDINPSNRLSMSDTQRDNPAFYPGAVTPCPTNCQNGDVDSNNAQVTDVWNISSTTINEARMGFTWQGNFYTSQTLGLDYPSKMGWQFAKANESPSMNFCSSSYNVCSPYTWINPQTNSVYKEMVFDPSDVVTMVRGKHVLHFGGEFLIYRDDSTAWGNTNPGTMFFSGQYTQNWTLDSDGVASPDSSTGAIYADYLLGQVQSWNAAVSPEYGARLKSPQMFIQDDFKALPNLTINVGLRYQFQHGWNEVKNNMSVFDPAVTNPATNTLGAMWYGATGANGRRSLQADIGDTFLPRGGFSWLPDPVTTIRGGVGLYAYNWSLDTYGNGMGAAVQSQGNLTDQTNGITPVVITSSSGSSLPYVSSTTDPTAFNGQSVNYNQYHTPLPKIIQWNLAVQREVARNMVAEVAYVASHGYNLAFPVDINQVPQAHLSSNDSAFRPYPQFQGISGSTNNSLSNYHSLQASINRRFSSGLSFNFNYVWSHFLDDQDSSGWGSRGGQQNYQNSYVPSDSYASSNFDVRNAFKGNVVYELPFGRGRKYVNNNSLADAIIGGWQVSGTVLLSSGNPFPIFADGNSYALAGKQYPNQIGNPKPQHRSINQWYNPAAFERPENGTFGNVRRNSIIGPGLDVINLSGSKTFSIWESVKLQIRCDAYNAMNHTSFGVPNQQLNTGNNGSQSNPNSYAGTLTNITTTSVSGRTVQLGARLQF
jgi:hypothetical protein